MTDFAIAMLCTAGLFLALLEDRFRLWATVACYAVTFLISLGAGWVLTHVLGPDWACAGGTLLFFAVSLVLSRNNPLQKFCLALVALTSRLYVEALLPLVLGAMPFSTAGIFGGVFSLLVQLLFALLMGVCLYRPFHHFSDRGPSAFLWGMCLYLAAVCGVCNGWVDFLFRIHVPAARLLLATLLLLGAVFVFRSVYQAGRFRQQATEAIDRAKMLDMEAGDFSDALTAVKEAYAARKAGEYALDTVNVMLADGDSTAIPAYIANFKRKMADSPLFGSYSCNPYLNGVIAAKAASAAHQGIHFQCNTSGGDLPLPTVEQCIIASEMLSRACAEAAAYTGEGKKRVSFTALPGEGTLTVETIYSGELPQQQSFSWKGKRFSQLLEWLFDDSYQEEDPLRGLEKTQEIVSRYSGTLSLSGAPGEVILHMALRL